MHLILLKLLNLNSMPEVDGMKFPYTKKGKEMAKKMAKKKGKKVKYASTDTGKMLMR